MRSFFAIEIDKTIKKNINKIIKQLREHFPDGVKWTSTDNLHVTLRFLGETKPEELEQCLQNIKKRLNKLKILEIEYTDIIMFPAAHPHIIAIKVNLSKELKTLFSTIEKAVVESGFEPENRQPLPHVTLGRLKKIFTPKLENFLIPSPLAHPVKHITLFRSDQLNDQSVYTALARVKLK